MANINNSIFKQYLGTLDEFKAYYAALDSIQQAALSRALVFIHDKEVNGTWNNEGYIFANGKYYACRESAAGLTLNTLLSLIETGDTSGVSVEEHDGKLVFTPVIKDELKALTSVGFVEPGKIWAARTPIEDILNDIFAKEIWYPATSSTIQYSNVITASIPAPTLTVTVDNVTITGSTTCEIGAPITLSGALRGSTATYAQNFTVTCNAKGSDGSNNNGFVLHGTTGYPTSATSGVTTSASIPVTTGSTGSDSLSITTGNKTGGFQSAIIDSNQLKFATGATNQYVHAGTNKIEIKSTSTTYTATANPGDTQKYLYTISNKGNYPTADTMDDVDVKQAISKTESVTPTKTSSITITGEYKYFIGNYSDSVFDNKIYSIASIREDDMTKSEFMNGTNITYTTTVPTGTKGMYIAIPAGVDDNGTTLKVKQVNTNAYVNEEMVKNKRTISLTCGGTHIKNYVIFTWSYPGGTKGEEPFEITSF